MKIKTYLICLFVTISQLLPFEVPTSVDKLSKIKIIKFQRRRTDTYQSIPELIRYFLNLH